jgi:co-chaperonin GroES (HSP10)
MTIMTSVKYINDQKEEMSKEDFEEVNNRKIESINKSLINDNKELTEQDIKNIIPFGPRVLIKLYIREGFALTSDGKKTSILLPQTASDMDKFITCVGEVIRINPSCYKGDRFKDWDYIPQVGDWVYFGRNNGTQLNYKGYPIMEIYDDLILGKVENPEDIRKD